MFEYKNFVVMPAKSDELLASTYFRLKNEGLLEILFYERVPTLIEFLDMYMRPEVLNLGAWIKADGKLFLVGFGSLDAPRHIGGGHLKGESSMCFFREYQNRETTLTTAQMILEWGFSKKPLAAVFGCTPVVNKSAIRFMRALGFEYSKQEIPNFTTIRGELCSIILSWMTREHWQAISPFRSLVP